MSPQLSKLLVVFIHRDAVTVCITGSVPGGRTATLALPKLRSKNSTFETSLYL